MLEFLLARFAVLVLYFGTGIEVLSSRSCLVRIIRRKLVPYEWQHGSACNDLGNRDYVEDEARVVAAFSDRPKMIRMVSYVMYHGRILKAYRLVIRNPLSLSKSGRTFISMAPDKASRERGRRCVYRMIGIYKKLLRRSFGGEVYAVEWKRRLNILREVLSECAEAWAFGERSSKQD